MVFKCYYFFIPSLKKDCTGSFANYTCDSFNI